LTWAKKEPPVLEERGATRGLESLDNSAAENRAGVSPFEPSLSLANGTGMSMGMGNRPSDPASSAQESGLPAAFLASLGAGWDHDRFDRGGHGLEARDLLG